MRISEKVVNTLDKMKSHTREIPDIISIMSVFDTNSDESRSSIDCEITAALSSRLVQCDSGHTALQTVIISNERDIVFFT